MEQFFIDLGTINFISFKAEFLLVKHHIFAMQLQILWLKSYIFFPYPSCWGTLFTIWPELPLIYCDLLSFPDSFSPLIFSCMGRNPFCMGHETSLSEPAFFVNFWWVEFRRISLVILSIPPFPKRKGIYCNNRYGHQYSLQSTPCLLGPAWAYG